MLADKKRFTIVAFGCLILTCLLPVAAFALEEFWPPLTEHDKQNVEARYQALCVHLQRKEYPAAYAFMAASYRAENTPINFKTDSIIYSIESACDWHKPIRGSNHRAMIYKYDSECFLCLDAGPFIFLVKEDETWYVEDAWYLVD